RRFLAWHLGRRPANLSEDKRGPAPTSLQWFSTSACGPTRKTSTYLFIANRSASSLTLRRQRLTEQNDEPPSVASGPAARQGRGSCSAPPPDRRALFPVS